ncbi:serine/threonine-protein kinase [Streptomyces sp. AV19]|uniref:serine/threonine-protein kinase n=1 Tax=Streptomyces sp. AV19 TaxID=2793068 RepID=UPI0024137A5A|nr:serine/threonine-protein kinase [Streptomyces sp. AV19]MDG4530830.1 protein kinase [Streptomyces sp. AV19]
MTAGETNGDELIGTALGGRYRVTATIGRGGMGVVARAVDELLNREVAVKVLRAFTDASAAELADLRARMQREAQAAARIRHGGVVTVHDVTEEQGLPVIVMELVDGPSLDDVLTERGALEPHEAAAIGAELMDALDAAHRAGVLHRDVKPANVLLERGGRVVLTDFGIASMEAGDEAMDKLTRSGQLVGSLDYLPPERAQGREPGPASDIWSLGMTLYAAVEGTSPFRRTSVWSTLSAIVTEPLPEPRRAGPLAPVLRALMAKEPESRPTADQARGMLARVAAGGTANTAAPAPTPTEVTAPAPPPGFGAAPPFHRPSPPPPAPVVPVVPVAGPAPGAGRAASGRGRRRGRALVAAAAAAVVLAGGGVTYALVGAKDDKDAKGGTSGTEAQAAPTAAGSPAGGGRTDEGGTIIGGTASASPSPARSTASPGKPSATPSRTPASPSAKASPTKAKPSATKAKPGSVSKSCGGWTHRDPKPGTYGYLSGDYHLVTGPYQACSSVARVKAGKKLWYHCSVVNAHGNTWIYARVEGTKTAGWMSADNLTRESGRPVTCT